MQEPDPCKSARSDSIPNEDQAAPIVLAGPSRKSLNDGMPCRAMLAVFFAAITFLGWGREIDYARDIQPLLSENCYQCHGPDAKARKAKLRLDVREDALRNRDGFHAILAGKPDESEVIHRIKSADKDEVMPPPKSGKSLSKAEINLIEEWIRQGATFSRHWAFESPRKPALPAIRDSGWPRQPLDRFVLARLEQETLVPAPEADRATWLRRASLDLNGLPPTPAGIDAFLSDKSPQAWEKAADRLLGSPHYGEHQGRYWLDAARYADTNGYQYDRNRDQWVWRDWVIHAFNSNKPFDQFTIEQMAGDLLPEATDQTRLATGFHRNHPITIEGGVVDEEYRTEYVIDRVVTTSTVWLGLTLICSRCHDHKYDPVSQEDFYRFFAFFNQVPERGLNGFNPKVNAPSPLAGADNDLPQRLTRAEKAYQDALEKSGADTVNWEKDLLEKLNSTWQAGVPVRMTSSGGTTLKALADQSILASGKNPGTDNYDLLLAKELQSPVSAIRLEALTHPSLTAGSASRGSNGNFVLSEFEVSYQLKGGRPVPVKINQAEADYEQKNYGIAAAIDGKAGRHGWAVDGNTRPENRLAVFTFANPIPAGAALRVRMVQGYGQSHQIGRFRVALAPGKTPPIPLAIQSILQTASAKRTPTRRDELAAYLTGRFGSPAVSRAARELAVLRREKEAAKTSFPATMVLSEKPGMRTTHVLERGEYDKKGRVVEAGIPSFFGSLPEGRTANRLDLAKWMTRADNPLTARVTVNRFWQQLFGTGIVKSSEDFGRQGEWPSHPRLLDYLAVDFVENGWDVKRFLRNIILSATYRQSSRITAGSHARDPENRLLARGPRIRLDAEVIRDNALFTSGLLRRQIGGPSVYPYHPSGLWLELNNRPGYSRTYPHARDSANLYRRSLYTYWKRTVPPPSMATFDAPEREFCMVRRSRTNTPLQAFVLMHDPQFVEAARFLAERMILEGGATLKARLRFGFRTVTSRQPSPSELSILQETLKKHLARYKADPEAATKLLSVGALPPTPQFNPSEHAAYTALARILLNLSETITKG